MIKKIDHWPNNRFFVGFWKEGKQNGVGKYIKGEDVKYGVWKNREREKWFDYEDEFVSCLDQNDEKYASLFQWGRSQFKKYIELDSN